MKKNIINILASAVLFSGALVSCSKQLDLLPLNDITSEQVYKTPEGY
ncbi:MAG: hypothetical protein RLZZ420_1988, partial [Bacteroidota bacterium]